MKFCKDQPETTTLTTEQVLFFDVARTLALEFVNHTESKHGKSNFAIFAHFLKTSNI